MMQPISFFIEGTPAPGGSKTAFPIMKDGKFCGNVVTDAGGKKNKDWKKVCAWEAKRFMAGVNPVEGPLIVRFTFLIARPACHYGTGKNALVLKPSAPQYHIVKPDALKFARSTEDALTGIIWKDDAQNVSITSEKRYAARDTKTGCIVTYRTNITTDKTIIQAFADKYGPPNSEAPSYLAYGPYSQTHPVVVFIYPYEAKELFGEDGWNAISEGKLRGVPYTRHGKLVDGVMVTYTDLRAMIL